MEADKRNFVFKHNKHVCKLGTKYCLKLAITEWEREENHNNEKKV